MTHPETYRGLSKPSSYKELGTTLDDTFGKAFDKVATMLGLPYQGGHRTKGEVWRQKYKRVNDQLYIFMNREAPKTSL